MRRPPGLPPRGPRGQSYHCPTGLVPEGGEGRGGGRGRGGKGGGERRGGRGGQQRVAGFLNGWMSGMGVREEGCERGGV